MKFVKGMFWGKYRRNWRENGSKYDNISLDVHEILNNKEVFEKANLAICIWS